MLARTSCLKTALVQKQPVCVQIVLLVLCKLEVSNT